MQTHTQAELFLPAAGGAEQLLADEITRLTGVASQAGRGGAWVHGDAEMAMRLNLHSRLAQRVLWPLVGGPYRDEHDLYDMARHAPWLDWINAQQTLRVDVHAFRSPLRSLNFAALRVKDAVCDVLREATGERPSVDTQRPDLPLVLHLGPDQATLYADTSGEALFKRGWRDARGGREAVKGEAPLKETLAAAMLAAAGWQGREEDGPLLDPCCGAGTIAIEAAHLACNVAPGLQRRFAFERQLPFQRLLPHWTQLRQQARAAVRAPAVAIHGSDVSFRMTDFAQRNAERAGVAQAIQFKTVDALQRLPPHERGLMLLNPPYGERMAPKGRGSGAGIGTGSNAASGGGAGGPGRQAFEGGASAETFFAELASHWKRHYAGWSAWLLCPDMALPRLMRLKESARVPMWNGPLECRVFRFDLVAGSNRDKPAGAA